VDYVVTFGTIGLMGFRGTCLAQKDIVIDMPRSVGRSAG